MENKETLASALCKAQAEFKSAYKDGANPHYKSKFSSLNELIEASRPALTKYGLTFVQYPDIQDGVHILVSKIKFGTEEEVSKSPIILKDASDCQSLGKAISYITRYVMRAMLGIAATDEDDDGNESAGLIPTKAVITPQWITPDQLKELTELLKVHPDKRDKILTTGKTTTIEGLKYKTAESAINWIKGK